MKNNFRERKSAETKPKCFVYRAQSLEVEKLSIEAREQKHFKVKHSATIKGYALNNPESAFYLKVVRPRKLRAPILNKRFLNLLNVQNQENIAF